MKKYETPSVEVTKFEVEDVILLSGGNDNIETDWGDIDGRID